MHITESLPHAPALAFGRRLLSWHATCRASFAWAFVSVLAFALGCPSASAQDFDPHSLDGLELRLQEARVGLAALEDLTLSDARLEREFPIEHRLQEGLILLEGGDPARASVLFLDVISREQWRNEPGYKQAMFLLAVALHESGHHASAKNKLESVLREGRPEDRWGKGARPTLLVRSQEGSSSPGPA